MRYCLLLAWMLPALLFAPLSDACAQSKPTSKPATPAKPGPKDPLVKPDPIGGGAGGKWGGRRGGRRRLVRFREPLAVAIGDGLSWLASHQDADGSWNAVAFMRHDKDGKRTDRPGEHIGQVGITSICLLSFLGDGSTLRAGPYRKVVEKATRWLLTQQKDSGTFVIPDNNNVILEHALATHAFGEACGLSRSMVIRPWATLAADWLAAQQNDDGGFSATEKGEASDAFTTCHAVIACKTAKDFRIIATDKEATSRVFVRAVTWFDKVTAEDGSVTAVGDVRIADGAARKETAAAAVLLGRFFLGQNPRRVAAMVQAANTTLDGLPAVGASEVDQVFSYLGSYGVYQMGRMYWNRWQGRLMNIIVETKRDDGNFKGSWDPVGKGAMAGGRVYATALSVLTLETYYRYTRLVR